MNQNPIAYESGDSPPETGRKSQAALRWICYRFVRLALFVLATIVIIGSLIRFTVKDEWDVTSTIFYATPLVLLVGGSSICLAAAILMHFRIRTKFWIVITFLLLATWLWQDWRWHSTGTIPSQSDQQELSVLFWNVARKQDLTGAADFLKLRNPDIIGLVEVIGDANHWKQFWKDRLPEYDVSALGGGLYVLTRGTSGTSIPHNLGAGSIGRQIQVELNGNKFEILVVDINANPRIPRRLAFQNLYTVAQKIRDQNTIIMGDFNTPSESALLTELRTDFRLCFDAGGRGYKCTWPTWLPLMQLDQIWTSSNIKVLTCRHYWTWNSDHKPVETRIHLQR
ncbi:endonuclease/exonuclease/phosphatase family protein [Planctomicrobium sp. SH668]|uniref:endonuclease/exonuclease/phosphatase family protein n=1 Tax=Planctomicrobium sp. SH668 TaxID=3448126 RepID=UPI003F5BD103